MKEQKFKRGDIVKRNVGHIIWQSKPNEEGVDWIDIEPESANKEAVIEYSYFEKFGGDDSDKNKYSIIMLDTGGSSAWHSDLTFVREGGEGIWNEIAETEKKRKARNTDWVFIIEQLMFNGGRLSSESVLFLFEKIGHRYKFFQNGEYYYLTSEWAHFYPLFFNVVIANEEIMIEMSKEPGYDKYPIKELWNEIQPYLPNIKPPQQ